MINPSMRIGRRTLLGAALGAFAGGEAFASSPLPRDITIALVGDMIYLRPSLAILQQDSAPLLEILRKADVTFGNFETNSFAWTPAFRSRPGGPAGPVVLTTPEATHELRTMGFDLVSHANNHAPDWGLDGIRATHATLAREGFAFAGSGENLAAARAPAFVTARGARVALIAATTSLAEGTEATDTRAGAYALKVRDGVLDAADSAGALAAIEAAKRDNAFVIFSLHTHQPGPEFSTPPAFQTAFARAVIDAGADIFAAHGPHELRGVEIYRGKPIFYSLGNFSIQLPPPELNPEPLVLPPGSIFTRRAFFESMIAVVRFRRGRPADVRLHPFELRSTNELATHCLPQPVSPEAGRVILDRVSGLSAPFGARIIQRRGAGLVREDRS
ncbi:MAG: CapA family protein [Hyphomonadaceae bacterium]|nr:CapA family protein [Hyphomonadaceae bacterium]